MRGALIAVGVAVVLVGLWAVSANNSLVKLDQGVKQSWSQVENVYQRRMDLIPNLVETVKGVANFEKDTYVAVADARAKATSIQLSPELLNDPQKFQQFEQAQNQLSGVLGRLMAISENYPDLKSNQNFLELQSELEGTENRIAVERMRYNQAAQQYNTAIRKFPGSVVANMSGFKAKAYFQVQNPAANQAPSVDFNFNTNTAPSTATH